MGAWAVMYEKGLAGTPGTPLAWAIVALKRELRHNGYGSGLNVTGTTFGNYMDTDTRAFQAQHGLVVDGVIGPVTAKQLYQKRFSEAEAAYGVPAPIVCQMVALESACDPGAVGVIDPLDHGIAQINARAHPEVTLDQAFDAVFSITFLASAVSKISKQLGDWDCGIAAWNIGGGAAQLWCQAGTPASAVLTFPDGSTWDYGAQASKYVQLVRGESC